MQKRVIRLGSRKSPLAVAQARLVTEAIRRAAPETEIVLVTMVTSGDKLAGTPLTQGGGKGLFVREIERALAAGEIDLAVHSYKDLPMEQPPGLPVVCVSPRADAREALVLPAGTDALPPAGTLGSASGRRACQLATLFPGRTVEPVHGNVQTRLQKLDAGHYAALVLAAAGLLRAGLRGRISRLFSVDELLPAACQGILAVQARTGEDVSYLAAWHSADAWDAATAERAFVRTLGGGCGTPVAAYAETDGESLLLRGLYMHETSGQILRGSLRGARKEAAVLGETLARGLQSRAQAL